MITVKDLIEELQKLDQNKPIFTEELDTIDNDILDCNSKFWVEEKENQYVIKFGW